jgi:hypothetical protein
MKILLRLWMIGTTSLILFMPPRLAFVQPGYWRGIPALEMTVFESRTFETRVAIVQAIAIILAVNFLPVVMLWKWDAIAPWLGRHRKAILWLAASLAAAVIALVTAQILTGKPDERQSAEEFLRGSPPAPTANRGHTLIPVWPATANQTRRALPAKSSQP